MTDTTVLLAPLQKLSALLAEAEALIEAKSNAVSAFDSALGTLVQNLLRGSGRLSKSAFIAQMKDLISDTATQAAEDAYEEQGGDAKDLDEEDLEFINEFVGGQQVYVDGFADWLKDKDSDLDQAVGRVGQWVTSMQNFAQQMAARAMGNPVLEFFGDDGANSCQECQELQGQKHKLKWWQGDNPSGLDYTKRNGNEAFGCKRFEHCLHSFVNPKTKEIVIA